MPRGDGTGPAGQGPGTGRGMGPCGDGRGRGGGRGRGQGTGGGRGMGGGMMTSDGPVGIQNMQELTSQNNFSKINKVLSEIKNKLFPDRIENKQNKQIK